MLKNILFFTLIAMVASSCHHRERDAMWSDRQFEADYKEEPSVKEKPIEVDLKTLMDAFRWQNDNLYEMNQKYVGKTLKVKGRTSGVSEDGRLTLQVAPTEEPIWCFDIPDKDFLYSVKINDVVEITGVFQRVDVGSMTEHSELQKCSEWKLISKSKGKK